MTAELQTWVGQARGGDRRAVEWLLQHEQQRIFAIAFHMLGRRDEAEEAAQEALIRIFTRLDQLREVANFRSWSAHIAANICRDRLRRQCRLDQPLEEAERPRDVAKNLGVSVPTLYRWIPAAANS